ncbi:hypothetical protein PR202_gb22536 [Eleusine coracana subsp. coracana]|uniref:RBR-type E3 ubiquitin transferase n=1 Tax=Eleusine coracana subsp. coracana TaxID=191504 RepID=A0AAV5FGI8_ELECO|nr:hypothetical protein PR202_gb22536 [Eleusine coracana subsp. coracana]
MEEDEAHDFVMGQKHQLDEEAINIVEERTHGNKEIVSIENEESMACDTTPAANVVEPARKDRCIQANVDGASFVDDDRNIVKDGGGTLQDAPRQEDVVAAEEDVDAKWMRFFVHPSASADVVWGATLQDAPRQDEAAPVEEDDGADRVYLFGHASATENDEEIAQALYMEELRQMENREIYRFEEPRPSNVFAGVDVPAAGQFEAMPHVFNGDAAQQANANNHHPISGDETIGIPLEPVDKDVMILARQEVLAGTSSTLTVLAGVEEVDPDDGWYDSIVHDAQRMEEMDDPKHCDNGVPFQPQLHRSESPAREEYNPTNVAAAEGDLCREFSLENFTKKWGLDPSELDPDEPGPSTKRRMRVLPLADQDLESFNCGICMETLPVLDLFHGMQCNHKFCVECMATYIEGRVDAGEVPIPCPDPECKQDDYNLHPEECKKSIDFAAFGNWGDRLTERAIPANRRAYCPNRQCGIMVESTGGKTPALAFCPVCGHAMCANCGFDWKDDNSYKHDCDEGPGAALVKQLADERQWKQCPKCRMLVERTGGCSVMRCSVCSPSAMIVGEQRADGSRRRRTRCVTAPIDLLCELMAFSKPSRGLACV